VTTSGSVGWHGGGSSPHRGQAMRLRCEDPLLTSACRCAVPPMCPVHPAAVSRIPDSFSNLCSLACRSGDLARPGSGPADRGAAGTLRGAARSCSASTWRPSANSPPRSSRTSAPTAPGSGASCSPSGSSGLRRTAGDGAATSTADRPRPPRHSQSGVPKPLLGYESLERRSQQYAPGPNARR